RCCTGMLPFRGKDTLAVLAALAQDRPLPPHEVNPNVPRALSDLVMKLLARDLRDRYPSAGEVAEVLSTIGQRKEAKRRWVGVLAAVAAALLLAAGMVYYVQTGEGKLVLEVNAADVKVTIDGNEVKIRSPRDELNVTVGRHVLHVSKDGFTTDT